MPTGTPIDGQPVVVSNVPGGSGFIAANSVARATPDGYTVFVTSSSTHAANKSLFKKLSYDPVADFEPVAKLGLLTLAMITHPSVPASNLREFIAYAKANPGKVSFGSGASSSRIAGELLKMMAGIDMFNVPYKSNPQAVTDLVGGQTSVVIADLTVTMPQVRGGRAKGLAVTSAKRSALAPELPTMSEAGVPGYELTAWLAAFVPAKTPGSNPSSARPNSCAFSRLRRRRSGPKSSRRPASSLNRYASFAVIAMSVERDVRALDDLGELRAVGAQQRVEFLG